MYGIGTKTRSDNPYGKVYIIWVYMFTVMCDVENCPKTEVSTVEHMTKGKKTRVNLCEGCLKNVEHAVKVIS